MQVGSYIQNASSTQLKPDNSKKGRKGEREREREKNKQQQPNAANKESS
jgi:hypothetical protein